MKRIANAAAWFRLACVAALVLSLAGCLQDEKPVRVAGGDDIPNDVEPLGKKSAAARDDSADWNGFKAMPRTSPGMYDTTSVPDSVPDTTGAGKAQPKRGSGAGALAKRSDLPADPGNLQDTLASASKIPPLDSLPLLKPVDTLVTKVVDTVKGTVEAVHAQVKDNVRTIDSTVIVPADPAKPGSVAGVLQVAGRVTYADTSVWKTYLFRDADGDGLLAPITGSKNLVDLDLAVKAKDGLVTHTVQRLAAGADLDFNKRGDNKLLSSVVAVTLGSDTLDIFKILDADGDSVAIDFSKDTNLVDLVEEHSYPATSLLASVSVQTRLVVYSKDSTRNYAVRYRKLTLIKAGGVVAVNASGANADSSFRPGNDALWSETTNPPEGDSLVSIARVYTVRLPAAPGAFAGDLLVKAEARDRFRGRRYETFAFSLRPAVPVADGHWPAAGAVEASLVYRDGAKTSFTGEAVAAGMEGVVNDVSGASLSVFFDRSGKVTLRR